MRIRRLFSRVSSSSLALVGATFLLAAPLANAATTKPYFKVYGGSAYTGGAFLPSASASCTSAANYQYSRFGTSDSGGGIYAYAKSASGNLGGSSSQYEAYALGPVSGVSSNNYGFYSGGSQNGLTFSNTATNASTWGGYFEGSALHSSCIPDYYDSFITGATAQSSGWRLSTSTDTGLYKLTGNPYDLVNSNVNIRNGQNITVFVKGSVYIDKDINYQNDKISNTPKFALVVQGNIYVGPGVKELDGLYIAQPSGPSATDGVFWSCHANDTDSQPISVWFNKNCNNKLTIDGAVIARQVNLMRLQGDINSGSASTNEAPGSNNVAEEINFTPAMILGGGFFDYSPSSKFTVDSITNLPPVF